MKRRGRRSVSRLDRFVYRGLASVVSDTRIRLEFNKEKAAFRVPGGRRIVQWGVATIIPYIDTGALLEEMSSHCGMSGFSGVAEWRVSGTAAVLLKLRSCPQQQLHQFHIACTSRLA